MINRKMAVSKQAKALTKIVESAGMDFSSRLSQVPEEASPESVRRAITQAAGGYIGPLQELYMMMETDARYKGLLRQLSSFVGSCPVRGKAAKTHNRGSKKAYELIMANYKRANVPRLIRQLTAPHVRGVTVWQRIWKLEDSPVMKGKTLFLRGLQTVPGSRLIMKSDPYEAHFGEIAITSQAFPQGRPVSTYPQGSILFGQDEEAEAGYYDMAGAARSCLGWWLAKTYTKSYWSDHNKTHGEPIRTAFVPDTMKPAELAKLKRFLSDMGRNMYGIFDEDIDIQLQNAVNTGTVSTYREMIEMSNDEMAVALVGQNQTSDGGRNGSYAKSAVHYQVQRLIGITVVQLVRELLYELNLDICKFNISEDFDPDDLPDYGPVVPRSEDKKTLVSMYAQAVKLVPVKISQIQADLDLEEPEDDDETIGPDTHQQDRPVDPLNPAASQVRPGENGKTRSRASEKNLTSEGVKVEVPVGRFEALLDAPLGDSD